MKSMTSRQWWARYYSSLDDNIMRATGVKVKPRKRPLAVYYKMADKTIKGFYDRYALS